MGEDASRRPWLRRVLCWAVAASAPMGEVQPGPYLAAPRAPQAVALVESVVAGT
eukprot:CAMPEP_0171112490 /NCGR_PEP_ID=MMETSP0766_2-20121228/79279_1 /TAXON_ID=439317 /ORGANISM="Gambierdiscus australes, Strain CAWD 149" /LENGTH=53 /DNA_ID=CAMNT_0011574603 /DNA_START=154 /DNA_END=315 /DNA_ORIENTATION=+